MNGKFYFITDSDIDPLQSILKMMYTNYLLTEIIYIIHKYNET